MRIDVHARDRAYALHVEAGVLARTGALVREAGLRGRVAVVHDRGGGRHLDALRAALAAAGVSAVELVVPSGEEAKTLAVAEFLWGELIREGFDRSDAVLALGGGAVCDVAGFVAATFHRGMPLVLVPTTLLAQVDAAIGGKTAVDHALGKNLIGALHPPHLVVCDPAVLATLPARERSSGLAEVVKAGLVADAGLVAEMELDLESLAEGAAPLERVASVVGRAAAVKAAIVSADEREAGRRHLLNFGHTLGHALEAATGYGPLRHGEAIVLGMRAAVEVSARLGKLSPGDAARARSLLARFPVPTIDVELDAVLDAAGRDKKRSDGRMRFVILTSIGAAELVQLEPTLFAEAAAAVLEPA